MRSHRSDAALLALLGMALTLRAAGATTAPSPSGERVVVVLRIEGLIGPAAADFVHRGLAKAQARGARLAVLELDTPGGLDTPMRTIIKGILASPVPVAAFVAPEGARADSAGTNLVYASHVPAMAPATNLGAATPVAIGLPGAQPPRPPGERPMEAPADKQEKSDKAGKEETKMPAGGPRDAMTEKAVNAAACIRSLAPPRGRNADFAERSVREARSLPAADALAAGVIDVVAADVRDLLRQIDGRRVMLANAKATLELAGARIETLAPERRSRLPGVLSNPTVALMLPMIGIDGPFVDCTSPGFGVPGVAGAISLRLALCRVIAVPGIAQMVPIDLRVVTLDVPPQDVISRDNVSVKVNAVMFFRAVDPQRAIIQVESFLMATRELAQTTLRGVLGKHDLDEMLAERGRLNLDVQRILDAQTDAWGIKVTKVTNVEIKRVDLNETMVRAIARRAEAAQMLARQPEAMQLRGLQTMTQVAGDRGATFVFPLPIDVFGNLTSPGRSAG